jgi:hypothetical protein
MITNFFKFLESKKIFFRKILRYSPILTKPAKKIYWCIVDFNQRKTSFGFDETDLLQIDNVCRFSKTNLQIKENIGSKASQRFLLVVVLTDTNVISDWIFETSERNWDLWIVDLRSSRDEIPGANRVYTTNAFITKSLSIYYLKQDIFISKFKYVAFFDDDLKSTVLDVNKIFLWGEEHDLDLFQPSLSDDSYINHENLKQVKSSPGFRGAPFVEIMCPFMSSRLIQSINFLPLLAPSGWGLDIAISQVCVNEFNRFPVVIDNISVEHTRKSNPQTGDFYKYLASNNVNPSKDLSLVNSFIGVNVKEVIQQNISNINNFVHPHLIIDESSRDYVRFLKEPQQNYFITFLMTKNEMDILPLWIDHHQDKFDLIFILDDFSEDGTTDFLKNLKSPNIVLVKRLDGEGYIQRELSTWIARHIAITFPQATIMPLDTDEFIDAEFDYKGMFLDCEKTFWVHKWATAIPINQTDRILTFDDLLFVEHRNSAEIKVAFRAKLMLDGFDLVQGNHSLAHPGLTNRFLPKEFCYLPDLVHVPVRCAEQVKFKKIQGSKSYQKRKFRNSVEGFHWKQLPAKLKKFELYNIASHYLRVENSFITKRRITRLGKPETKFNPRIRLRNFNELLH